MATEYVRSEEKHKTLQDAKDGAYLALLLATTRLKEDINYNRGTFILDYQDFLNSFAIVFELTRDESEMQRYHKELIDEIEHWQDNGSAVKTYRGSSRNKKIVMNGMKLARVWCGAMQIRDVIKG